MRNLIFFLSDEASDLTLSPLGTMDYLWTYFFYTQRSEGHHPRRVCVDGTRRGGRRRPLTCKTRPPAPSNTQDGGSKNPKHSPPPHSNALFTQQSHFSLPFLHTTHPAGHSPAYFSHTEPCPRRKDGGKRPETYASFVLRSAVFFAACLLQPRRLSRWFSPGFSSSSLANARLFIFSPFIPPFRITGLALFS